MLAFLDESGDPGLKLGRGSSRLFVVAMAVFPSGEVAQRCDDRIAALRASLSLPPRFEFHFSRNSRRVRERFLGAVQPFSFGTHVFAVDKVRLLAGGLERSTDRLYQLAVREVLEDAAPHLTEATVVVDGTGTRQGRNDLAVHLRQRLTAGSLSSIRKLKDQRSESHNLSNLPTTLPGWLHGLSVGTPMASFCGVSTFGRRASPGVPGPSMNEPAPIVLPHEGAP